MLIVDVIRHAESEWVLKAKSHPVPLFGGRLQESKLSPEGCRQAEALGRYAKAHGLIPDVHVCSPAVRTVSTCKLSSAAMGAPVRKPTTDNRLQELDWGAWTGQPRSLMEDPEVQEARRRLGLKFAPPRGESYEAVGARAQAALLDIARKFPDGYAWVHSHKNVIAALARPFTGWNLDQISKQTAPVVSRTRFEVARGKITLVEFGVPTI